jgi:hypothetical protein
MFRNTVIHRDIRRGGVPVPSDVGMHHDFFRRVPVVVGDYHEVDRAPGVEAMNLGQNHLRAGEAEFDTEFLLVLTRSGDRAAPGRWAERDRNGIG